MPLIPDPVLRATFERVMATLAADDRCLGAWHFGSLARGLADRHSDVDPVVLVRPEGYEALCRDLPALVARSGARVQLVWPQGYNSDYFRNYGLLLEDAGELFQFDCFLMRADRVDEHFCRVHRDGCSPAGIIFDPTGAIRELLARSAPVPPPEPEVAYLVDTYYFHANMALKYLLRPDPLKLMNLLQSLYQTHRDVLVATTRQATWGSPECRVALDARPAERAELLAYFGPPEPRLALARLEAGMASFERVARAACAQRGLTFPAALAEAVCRSLATRTAPLRGDV